jgi:hypothetical protein
MQVPAHWKLISRLCYPPAVFLSYYAGLNILLFEFPFEFLQLRKPDIA